MTVVTTHYRYKPPPRKRKTAPLPSQAIVREAKPSNDNRPERGLRPNAGKKPRSSPRPAGSGSSSSAWTRARRSRMIRRRYGWTSSSPAWGS